MTTDTRNALDLIPLPRCEWTCGDDGRVTLVVPRFKQEWLLKLIRRLKRSETVKVHLDETGSRVWREIDGKRSIEEIGKSLDAKEDETVQQRYERLSAFMMILHRNQFVAFRE